MSAMHKKSNGILIVTILSSFLPNASKIFTNNNTLLYLQRYKYEVLVLLLPLS